MVTNVRPSTEEVLVVALLETGQRTVTAVLPYSSGGRDDVEG